MSIDYKEMFSKFPVIESQFDMVSIDCIRMGQSDDYFFVPIIRYMMRNHDAKKVEAGLTIITAATCEELIDVTEFITTIAQTGFFLNQVSAFGTIYTEDMTEIEDVNWNAISKMNEDKSDNTEQQKPTYLH